MEINLITLIIIGVVALISGIGIGKLIFSKNTALRVKAAEEQAEKILSDARSTAENLKKEKLLEAKEKNVQLKAEHDREILEKNKKIGDAENRILQKELVINQKTETLEKQVKENEAINPAYPYLQNWF